MVDLNKYRFYNSSNGTTVAVSTFAGKTVRGTAKCAPNDEFDSDSGELLAAARCGVKIAEKRVKRAEAKYNEALQMIREAANYLGKMNHYLDDSRKKYKDAIEDLNFIYEEIISNE